VMTHDGAEGRMYLEDDRLRIDWPGVGSRPIFEKVNQRLAEATHALGGVYLRDPIWTRLLNKELVTVHPLGGCPMGEDAEHGVVDHKGRVFSGEHGDDVYDGLYVSDGAVMPRSLGVNPLLTISAVAERNVALLASDRGWKIDYTLPTALAKNIPPPLRLGIEFTETMKGYFSTSELEKYERGWDRGKKDTSPFQFTLTIVSEDLELMLSDEAHKAEIAGTVIAPMLSAEPLTVTRGEFNLFVRDAAEPGTRKMRYRMHMTSEESKTYFFDGFKLVRDDAGVDMWSDTTTLYITIYESDGEGAAVVGKGILKIKPMDFARQMTTMQVKNAANLAQVLEANARFVRYFAGALFDTYARLAHGKAKERA